MKFSFTDKLAKEILLKVIDKVFSQYPDVQDFINASMIGICREETSYHTRYFLFYFVFTIILGLKNDAFGYRLKNSQEEKRRKRPKKILLKKI